MGSISSPPIRRSKVRLTTDFTGSGGNIDGFEQVPFHITDEDSLGIVGAGDGSSSVLTTKVSGLYLIEAQLWYGDNVAAGVREELIVRISGVLAHSERRWASATQSGYVSATITRGLASGAAISVEAFVQSDNTVDVIEAYLAVTRLGPIGVAG